MRTIFIISCCMLFVIVTCELRRKDQRVKTHQPWEPILYPEDFCPEFQEDTQFDYVVVGAGPAGAPIARRLAEDPSVKVLVLEGGDDPPPETDVPLADPSVPLWNITTEKKENQCLGMVNEVCQYTYPMALGGASINNAMMYVRGNHKDYDEWEEEGCPGWGWKDIFPYFKKLENYENKKKISIKDKKYHSKGGPFTTSSAAIDELIEPFKRVFLKALAKNKVPHTTDPNGERQTGYGDITGCLDTVGYRNNVAKAYLLNIPDNLKVCKNAVVHKLIISKDKAVSGVEFVYKGKQKKVAKAKEYILAAGPISSPQILERSGIGRKDVLEKAGVKLIHELKGVGENLYEQFLNLGCAFAMDINTQTVPNPMSITTASLGIFLDMNDFSNPVPNMQFIVGPSIYKKLMFQDEISKQYDEKQKLIFAPANIILRQTNTGYVHITGKNPLYSPSFQPNQYTSDDEKKLLGDGCRLMRKALSDPLVADYNLEPIILKECKKYKFNSDKEILCQAGIMSFPLYHLAGTTKMGDDEMSVVDTQMRVHGIKKLRVVDLGVMPKVPRGNTEIPTIAVSEKAAEMIKKGK